MADNKTPLERFLTRLYCLRVFKFGQCEDRFIVIENDKEIHEVVDLCKKWCNKNQFRFMGVRPLFEFIKED